MSLLTIRNELYDIVDALKGSAGFADTYKEMPTDIPETPAVAILLDEAVEDYSSTGKNALDANYVVRCMAEKTDSSDDDEAQTTKVITLADAIMDELRKDDNRCLSGSVHSVMAVAVSKVQLGLVGNTSVYYIDITMNMKTFKSITL